MIKFGKGQIAQITLLLLLFVCSGFAHSAKIWLEVDPIELHKGGIFNLNINYEGRFNSRPPAAIDPLDPSLEIISGPTMNSLQTSFRQGMGNFQATWTWQVQANKVGTFDIPAFELAGMTTNPGEVKVIDGAALAKAMVGDDILVTYEADKPSAIVGEQIILTWRILFYAKVTGNVQVPTAPASFEHELLEPRKGKSYTKTINGRPYDVKEFKKVVFGTEPGQFTFDPVVFTVQYRDNGPGFKRMKSAVLESDPLPIEILDNNNTQKLPRGQKRLPATEKLQVSSQWAKPDQPIDVGEPVTLEIHMSAPDQIAKRLPDIKIQAPKGLKIYDDGEESKQTMNWDKGITGYKTLKYAIIPQKSGVFTIPPIKIAWWNTKTKALETTEVPGETLTVGTGVQTGNDSQFISSEDGDLDEAEDDENTLGLNNKQDSKASKDDELGHLWQNIALIVILVLVLIALFAYKRASKKAQQRALVVATEKEKDERQSKKPLSKPKVAAPLSMSERKKVQLELVPMLEIHPHDQAPRETCRAIIQRLCLWASHETTENPRNITQLIQAIQPQDHWIPVLKKCELFLYAPEADPLAWPKEEIRQALLDGLPKLKGESAKQAKDDDDDIAPFVP